MPRSWTRSPGCAQSSSTAGLGTADIAKTLCLGADAVIAGCSALREFVHSGAESVADVLWLLMGEFEEVMALMRAPTVVDFERSGVVVRKGARFSP
ncbi:alpha-hydroxy-acid oxidizing protein [Streptomyces sp. NBC_00663]|uniref:alpha-hydroxy-acid oxidizing protein n=1 Tax=Streptomyces sp. NBC_00663 TaxID=2975801 RepID=UPI002E364F2B|nr:alpha-hydroxy-acid oxidizing protein [Streptomyces sp. NBC_00663]